MWKMYLLNKKNLKGQTEKEQIHSTDSTTSSLLACLHDKKTLTKQQKKKLK